MSVPPWWGPETPSSKGMACRRRHPLSPGPPREESPLPHWQQASAPRSVLRGPKCHWCWPGYRPIVSELGHPEHSCQLAWLPLCREQVALWGGRTQLSLGRWEGGVSPMAMWVGTASLTEGRQGRWRERPSGQQPAPGPLDPGLSCRKDRTCCQDLSLE